ncbi:MAG: putative metal-binding motif-containing protein, partial [Myxococcota bacterium]
MRHPLLWLSWTVVTACGPTRESGDSDVGGITVQDNDGDGLSGDDDCDDDDPLVNVQSAEVCDGIDNDCDGEIDEGVTSTFYDDQDGDGYGDPSRPLEACAQPDGSAVTDTDCDDGEPAAFPGNAEVCDTVDNDCDGTIDEGVTTDFYADKDTDGYGDPDDVLAACALPGGYVVDDTDCDDAEPVAFPGNPEVCDTVDNDCDGTVDEGVTTTYYVDVDADGFGKSDETTEACALPTGYAARPGDCADALAQINPDAVEICNDIDDDCDTLVDDADDSRDPAFGGATFYADADADTFGDPSTARDTCLAPAGYVSDNTDCDDTLAAVNPDAEEVCNDIDDDCDALIDDDDRSLNAATGSTFYADTDGDGFGDGGVVTAACEVPDGYVADNTDCDDEDEDANPDADEYCDGHDDNCDGEVDEDAALDAELWFRDVDVDGFGDGMDETVACYQPSGYVADDTDCDDDAFTTNPGALEYCDGHDDDCDGDIDENDAVDAETWYLDSDEDGYGDPDRTLRSCAQPSGHVGNDEDCDDLDPLDTDDDGLQDCEDDDIDGDGVRNQWDADPYDDDVTRAPTAGLGTDGDLSVTGTTTLSERTRLSGAASAASDTIDVVDAGDFAEEDEILILSMQGTDAGQMETVFITDIDGDTLTIEPPLSNSYTSSSVVLVQRVPHYEDVTVSSSGTLRPDEWAGDGGGVLFFRATGDVSITGTVTADGRGFRGGNGVSGNGSNPRQGESYRDSGSTGDTSANEGGGGAHPRRADNGDSGAGGAYGSRGGSGTNYGGSNVTTGGLTYGTAALTTWFLGSGGVGGSPDTEGDGSDTRNRTGAGGDGGGIIVIFAGGRLSVTGTITADGNNGGTATSLA